MDEDDKILRIWTPVILRALLGTATAFLALGIAIMLVDTGDSDNVTWQAMGSIPSHSFGSLSGFLAALAAWDPVAFMMLGLMALTLIPLARVAFCFLFFLKQRNWIFVGFTAYVLVGLAMGIMLGKIG